MLASRKAFKTEAREETTGVFQAHVWKNKNPHTEAENNSVQRGSSCLCTQVRKRATQQDGIIVRVGVAKSANEHARAHGGATYVGFLYRGCCCPSILGI